MNETDLKNYTQIDSSQWGKQKECLNVCLLVIAPPAGCFMDPAEPLDNIGDPLKAAPLQLSFFFYGAIKNILSGTLNYVFFIIDFLEDELCIY